MRELWLDLVNNLGPCSRSYYYNFYTSLYRERESDVNNEWNSVDYSLNYVAGCDNKPNCPCLRVVTLHVNETVTTSKYRLYHTVEVST